MSNLDLTTDEYEIAQCILRYIFARPRARDSIQSIAENWIRRQRLEETVTNIRRVLTILVKEGLIIEFDDPQGFAVNRQRLDDIAKYIKTSSH